MITSQEFCAAYKVVAFAAIRQENPEDAARIWKSFVELCDVLLQFTTDSEMRPIISDYKREASRRFSDNFEDSQFNKV